MQVSQFSAPPPHSLNLESDEIHIWRVSLDCDEQTVRGFRKLLDREEQARADQFVFGRDRDQFIVTRGALRHLLGQYAKCPPTNLKFGYGSKGKPSLMASPRHPSIQFSVSHSHALALLAFAARLQLGIDVESIRPDFATAEIAERYFSPEEIAELRALPSSLQPEGFFLCWTRKEAYLKATGEGLHVALQSFSVSLTPGNPARLNSRDSSVWRLVSLEPAPRYVGALVVEERGGNVRLFDFREATPEPAAH